MNFFWNTNKITFVLYHTQIISLVMGVRMNQNFRDPSIPPDVFLLMGVILILLQHLKKVHL